MSLKRSLYFLISYLKSHKNTFIKFKYAEENIFILDKILKENHEANIF